MTLSDKRFLVFERYAPHNFWYKYRNKLIEYFLKRYTRAKHFLEVGCGIGLVINYLRKDKDMRISGCDMYLEALAYAKKRNDGVNFFQYNLLMKNDLKESYDTVGCFDVLEHIDDDKLAIQNLFQLVKPGGNILIIVPIDMRLWGMNDVINEHKRRYSKHEILQKLKEAGFEIVVWNRFTFLLYPLLRIVRFLQKEKPDIVVEELDECELASFLNLKQGKLVGRILYGICLFEMMLIKSGVRLPWGGSIIVLARKT